MRSFFIVVSLGLLTAIAGAQVTKKEAPKSDIAVDIHFMNGSTVRMKIHTEKLEMETIYGKLTIPARDIRSIEFGARLPEGFAEKIDAAVKKLGHSDFREREKASAAMLELGPYSYAAALEASRVKESEISGRGKIIVLKLQTAFPKKDLKISADDKVVTPTLTLTGRLLAPRLQAKADYFGAVELSLADMRTLRAVGTVSGDISVAIDAAKYAVQGQWLATTFQADGRTNIVITAKGQVDLWPEQNGQFVVGPTGVRITAANPFGAKAGKGGVSRSIGGQLLGKIGENGDPFTIGERFDGIPSQAGTLYLSITPSTYSTQSSGSYEVRAGRKTD
jgi:hypothetical protein